MWKTVSHFRYAPLSTESFPGFPHGFLGKSISFQQLGVDFPQSMWYTIILVTPA
jgi:hypothetical protein